MSMINRMSENGLKHLEFSCSFWRPDDHNYRPGGYLSESRGIKWARVRTFTYPFRTAMDLNSRQNLF
jgi:hypothetical protein